MAMKWQKIIFAGEEFEFEPEQKILKIHIKEPFYSAGKKFGWGHPVVGFSINYDALMFAVSHNCKIWVKVGDKPKVYETDAKSWLEFVRQFKSIDNHTGIALYVMQWSDKHFKTLPEPNSGTLTK
jgi:hypothetical protein